MAFRRPKSQAGVTLIEVMAAMVIMAIAVLGASGYRYYSALDARKAADQSTAARVALLLSENWRGIGYDRTGSYDPAAYFADSGLTITDSAVGPAYASGFTSRGKYEIVVNNARYFAALSYKQDAPGLRMLNTVVAWSQNRRNGGDGPSIVMDKTFKLTTYVSD